MKKILLILILLFPISIFALELPNTYSNIVYIYDLTDDQVLLAKNSDTKTNIASLTKIMTTITAIEKNEDLSKEVTVTDKMLEGIPWDASIAGLKVGETYTINDLLYASILPSGADATQVLAFTSSGSISSFVSDMNKLAQKIGVKNTHFVNVTGLDIDNHYSNAEDILLILKYALNNPIFKEIYCTKEYQLSNTKIVKSTLYTYTKNNDIDISKIIGSKTGYTSKAGTCISVLTNIHNHNVIIITLQAPFEYGKAYNLQDAVNLINFSEANYANEKLITKGALIKSIPVSLAKIDKYDILANIEITKFLPKDYDKSKFAIVYEGLEELSFKNQKDTVIGHIKYLYDGEKIAEEEVKLNQKIDISIKKIIKKYYIVILIFCLIIILIVIIVIFKGKKRKKKIH